MYDVQHILQVMAAPTIGAIVFASLSTLGNIAYFLEMMRVSFKDKAYSYTVGALFLGLAHDANFVLEYHKWFHVYNDPSMKMWWYFIIFACLCEFVYFWQLIRFGHRELFPQIRHAAFAALCIFGFLGVVAAWVSVKQFLDDDIYMFAFGVTVFWQAPFSTALMLRRGTSLGASTLQWVSFLVMASGYFGLTILYFGAPFNELPWIGLGLATLLWGSFNLWLVRRLPPPEPLPRAAI